MLELVRRLLESDFMPHGYCFGWRPDILWLHVTSDGLIALSYFLIPFTLIYLVRARRDFDFRWMAALFGAFILSCGATHVFGIVTLWHPVYRLEGVVKAVTALASLPTAVLLIWLAPKAIALPSPRQLQTANEEVLRLNRDLESRVEERAAELAEAEHRYRQLFELSPLPMWVREPDGGRFLAVNAAATELYGYSEAEFLAMTVRQFVLSGDTPPSPEQGKPWLQRHARKSGAPIFAEVRFRQMRFGAKQALLVLSTDITERKALEEQLRHSQKMEAIGRLAGGIAHDFNNLLTVILGYATVAQRKLLNDTQRKVAAAGDPVVHSIREIQRAAEHAASLTGQLLAFSRKQVSQPRVLDLNAEVRGMTDILHRLLGEDIQLSVRTDDEPCLVEADAGQLSQIIMNLAVNARDAMPKGGRLSIETASVLREREDVGDGEIRPAGRYCRLSVSDTGPGIAPEVQPRIFEPFFTTKAPGTGTGLGLSTVYGIVVQHNGWIDVASEPGHGSTFRIYCPAAASTLQEPAAAAAEAKNREMATILLVEDQAALRLLAEDLLSEAGHRVLSAGNGRAALELAERHNGPIDMLVTDVVMPEMNGPDLAEQLSLKRPGLLVLYVSGYTDHALLDRGAVESAAGFLHKPFPPDALPGKVEELLRSRAGQ
jgi:two-component system, cell cycle sensor histidine kinase and response regulator CckA